MKILPNQPTEPTGIRMVIQPVKALLMSVLAADVAGLLTFVTLKVATTGASLLWQLKAAFSLLLFGTFIGLFAYFPILLARCLPVFIMAWLPLWIWRRRCSSFWRWRTAPLVGGVITIVVWSIWERLSPLFPPDYAHSEMVAAYYVGAVAGGVCMFAAGCARSSPTDPRKADSTSGSEPAASADAGSAPA